MKEKYYYNFETEEIYKGACPFKEITKEEYYVIKFARMRGNENFRNRYQFNNWCRELGLDQEKTKDEFIKIGHPMDFLTR